jgi:hypothetical protein
MIKKNWILILFCISVVVFLVSRYRNRLQERHTISADIAASTFQSKNGWGYDILKDGEIFIHQDFIPAVNGRKTFSTEADAKKIAGLMLIKMKQSSKLPDISLQELDSCGIRY